MNKVKIVKILWWIISTIIALLLCPASVAELNYESIYIIYFLIIFPLVPGRFLKMGKRSIEMKKWEVAIEKNKWRFFIKRFLIVWGTAAFLVLLGFIRRFLISL